MTVLLVQVAATWFMVGLIWTIQVVHYPLFARVGQEQFAEYSKRHQFLITWIVGPAMVAELLTAVVLALYPPAPDTGWWLWTGVILLLVIWVSTALIQAPQHSRLATDGHDRKRIRSLVTWNWIRTITWSARGVLVLIVLQRLLVDT